MMRGLLIKDYLLIKNQMKFVILFFIIALIMIMNRGDAMFVISYLTFVITSCSLSTISYDEYENSNSYLFSLPITRVGYVKEKYLFAFINAGVGWLLGMLMVFGYRMIQNQAMSIQTISFIGGMNLICVAAYIAVCLPLWIKLGPEKGRITFFILAGLIVLATSLSKLFAGNIDPGAFASVWNILDAYPLLLVGILGGIVLLGVGVSYLISLGIVRKKEF